VLEAFLLSPQFLYVPEPGHPLAGGVLQGYAAAAALSYTLWQTMPDQALFDAARVGALTKPEDVRAWAARLLQDPRGAEGVRQFVEQWLGLRALEGVEKADVAGFSATALRTESELFLDHLVRRTNAPFPELLTARYSLVPPASRSLYGLPAVRGDEPARTDLDPKERLGILTQPAFLTAHTHGDNGSMIFRGKFLRENLLCQKAPMLPQDVDIDGQVNDSTVTPRKLMEERLASATCGGCHKLMDLVGVAFDRFDAVGRHRTQLRDAPIDASGEVVGTRFDGPFRDHTELIPRLAQAEEVRDCWALQWGRFVWGREEVPDAACWTSRLAGAPAGEVRLGDLVLEAVTAAALSR
jgi:hypothetical protein